MPTPGRSSEGRALNDWIRNGPMADMAEELGVDELPMRDQNYDFYGQAVSQMAKAGVRGQDRYDDATEILSKLFYDEKTGERGDIFYYLVSAEKNRAEGKPLQRFDEYFWWSFHQKVGNYLKYKGRKKRQKPLSITPGYGEDEGGSSADLLEDPGKSPQELAQEREEEPKHREVWQKIPQMLADSGNNGWKLEALWEAMQHHIKLDEIAAYLNDRNVPTLSGGKWDTGSVWKTKNQVLRMVRRHFGKSGLDEGSVLSFRVGSRMDFDSEVGTNEQDDFGPDY